jgi:hypothetical protein
MKNIMTLGKIQHYLLEVSIQRQKNRTYMTFSLDMAKFQELFSKALEATPKFSSKVQKMPEMPCKILMAPK